MRQRGQCQRAVRALPTHGPATLRHCRCLGVPRPDARNRSVRSPDCSAMRPSSEAAFGFVHRNTPKREILIFKENWTSVDSLGHAADVWGQVTASSNLASPTTRWRIATPDQSRVHPAAGSSSTSRSAGELGPPARVRHSDVEDSLVIRVEITAVRSRSRRCQELGLTTGWDGEGRCGRTAKRPVFRASDRAPIVTELTRSRANTEGSGPKDSAGQPGFGNRAGGADGDRGLPGWPDAGQRRPVQIRRRPAPVRTPATDR